MSAAVGMAIDAPAVVDTTAAAMVSDTPPWLRVGRCRWCSCGIRGVAVARADGPAVGVAMTDGFFRFKTAGMIKAAVREDKSRI